MTDNPLSDKPLIAECAERFVFDEDTVSHLLRAVSTGGGDMAMFDHPELAGPGQWMRGGLVMITTPLDDVLKNRIDALCSALSDELRRRQTSQMSDHARLTPDARAWDVVSIAGDQWWPSALGEPSATGSQGDLRYAYFDPSRRLAILSAGDLAVYDTGEHRITGVSQSQHDGRAHVVFTSQLGVLSLDQLRRNDDAAATDDKARPRDEADSADTPPTSETDIFEAIERLASLYERGVLTEAEFTSKKQELLNRL